MRVFPRPTVIISRCLGFSACRYDGGIINDPFVKRLSGFVDFKPVCPEKGIGLGVPRDPIRLVQRSGKVRLVQPASGRDITAEMKRFCQLVIGSAHGLHGMILKSRSPSCGIRDARVFDAPAGSKAVGKGAGFFAAAAMEKFPWLPAEDERRLLSPQFREHFLTRLFLAASFDEVLKARSLKRLTYFHRDHSLLLRSFSARGEKELRLTIENASRRPLDTAVSVYQSLLNSILSLPARRASNVAALSEAALRLGKGAGKRKEKIAEAIRQYRDGNFELDATRQIIRHSASGLEGDNRAAQTFLEPYPKALE